MKMKSPETFDPRQWTAAEALFHFSELSGEDIRPYRARYDWKTDTFYLWRKKSDPEVEIYGFFDNDGYGVSVAECYTTVKPDRTPFVKDGNPVTMVDLLGLDDEWFQRLLRRHEWRAEK